MHFISAEQVVRRKNANICSIRVEIDKEIGDDRHRNCIFCASKVPPLAARRANSYNTEFSDITMIEKGQIANCALHHIECMIHDPWHDYEQGGAGRRARALVLVEELEAPDANLLCRIALS